MAFFVYYSVVLDADNLIKPCPLVWITFQSVEHWSPSTISNLKHIRHRQKINLQEKLTGLIIVTVVFLFLAYFVFYHLIKHKKRLAEDLFSKEKYAHDMAQKALGGRLKKKGETLRLRNEEVKKLQHWSPSTISNLKLAVAGKVKGDKLLFSTWFPVRDKKVREGLLIKSRRWVCAKQWPQLLSLS